MVISLLCGNVLSVAAASVVMKTHDALNTSSFTGATNWNPAGVPSPGNTYSTSFQLRTTNVAASGLTFTFGGDSLALNGTSRFLGKVGNGVVGNTTVATFSANYIFNGGFMDQGGVNNDYATMIIAGTVTVAGNYSLGALGAISTSPINYFETLEIIAPISGSGALTVSGPGVGGGHSTGVVKLSAANPYSGIITVSNATSQGSFVASYTNRMLQLNHLNALSNATLNLPVVGTATNPVSFAAAVNTGPFNVGTLSGAASEVLSDTLGGAVALSLGGNNGSSTYSGVLSGNGSLIKVGAGTLTLAGANTYSGTTSINTGSLQLGNGGATGSLSSSSTLTVNGNLAINRNNAVTQGADFGGGPITGTGSFTQAGAGTTTLNAANSYSGSTSVNAGKLVISSAQIGTGALTVANGAKLGITVSGVSQLPPSTLTLGTGAATTLEFNGVSSTTVAPIIAGALAVGGTVTVNINTGTFAAGNSYPLIHWTGSGPADASSFTLGASPGLTATFSVSSGTLYLDVAGVSDVWSGMIDGNWDTSTANWTGNATIFADGHSVVFDDAAVGTTNVIVSVPVQPSGMVFNNNSLAYAITSSGGNKIGGSGGLIKNNSASVTLAGGVNDFTGATVVNGGQLSVGVLADGGVASDLGAAGSASAKLVLNGGTLQYTGSGASTDRGASLGSNGGTISVAAGGAVLTNSGVIIGSGALTKSGSGALTLSGANTFSGGVTLSAGQLNINNGGSSSANSAIGTGPLTISANTIIDNTSGGDVTLLPNNLLVWGASFTYAGSTNLNLGTGSVSLSGTCAVTVNANTLTVGGVIGGAAGLTKLGAGTLVLTGANSYGNNGAANTALSAGTLAIGHDFALGTSLLSFGPGVTVRSADSSPHTITNSINFAFGAGNTTFDGAGNLKFTGSAANASPKTMTVNNPQTEFSGVLSGAMARTVAGTGMLIFSGANTYSLGTTINPGATLQLGTGGTSGSLSTSGVITNDGTLRFSRSDAIIQGTHFSSAPITGSGSVIQVGSGATMLNAMNTYTGSTIVSNGLLGGTGAIAGDIVVVAGATLGAGNISIGTFTVGGTPTLAGTILAELNRTNAQTADKIVFSGGAVFGGALTVTNTGLALVNGDNFDLFDGTLSGSFATLNLPYGPGHWNTSDLNAGGTITFINANPVASNFEMGVPAGGAAAVSVIGGKYVAATDADGDAVSIIGVTTPANGTVSIIGGTNLLYTSTNTVAGDSFDYTVGDGVGGTDTKTVTVTIYNPEGFNRLSPPSVIGAGTVALSYLGIPGHNYALDWATNLTPPINWMALQTNAAAGNGVLNFTNTSSEPVNFFRTRHVP